VREAYTRGLPLWQTLLIIPYITPEVLCMTIPAALLFGVASVYGRMSAGNEIMAISAQGVRPLWIIAPVLALACVLSVGTFWLYEVVGCWSRPHMRRVVQEALAQIALEVLTKDRHFTSPDFSIAVKGVEGRRLLRPYITCPARSGRGAVLLTAESGELCLKPHAGLVFVCQNGRLSIDGQVQMRFFDSHEQPLPTNGNEREDEFAGSTRTMPMRAVRRLTQLRAELVTRVEREASVRPVAEDDTLQDDIRFHRAKLAQLNAEPHRRWANGFCCLSFSLLGIPVAIMRRNSCFLSSFMVCFLPILTLYYPLLILAENATQSGAAPPYAVWAGNLLMMIAGIGLLRRAHCF